MSTPNISNAPLHPPHSYEVPSEKKSEKMNTSDLKINSSPLSIDHRINACTACTWNDFPREIQKKILRHMNSAIAEGKLALLDSKAPSPWLYAAIFENAKSVDYSTTIQACIRKAGKELHKLHFCAKDIPHTALQFVSAHSHCLNQLTITCSTGITPKDLIHLPRTLQKLILHIHGLSYSEEDINDLPPNLTHLDFLVKYTNPKSQPDDAENIVNQVLLTENSQLKFPQTLIHLGIPLKFVGTQKHKDLFKKIFPDSLTSLYLRGPSIFSDEDLQFLPNLKALWLEKTGCTGSTLDGLPRSLKILNADSLPKIGDVAIQSLPNLEQFALSGFEPQKIPNLRFLPHSLTCLTLLKFRNVNGKQLADLPPKLSYLQIEIDGECETFNMPSEFLRTLIITYNGLLTSNLISTLPQKLASFTLKARGLTADCIDRLPKNISNGTCTGPKSELTDQVIEKFKQRNVVVQPSSDDSS